MIAAKCSHFYYQFDSLLVVFIKPYIHIINEVDIKRFESPYTDL